jgi:hypothetical protein
MYLTILKSERISGKCAKMLTQGRCRLVDPHSQLYRHLSAALRPLEPQDDGIIVTIEANDPITHPTVYLPRHDLTFYLTESSLLECQSFPGLVVNSNYHDLGTLIGLQTFISLRSTNARPSQRKVLIPKGILSSIPGRYGHPLTSIDVKDARGYFAYEIDDVLGRLHGSRSVESDLFLARLHALTSSPLPDHLTGIRGTNKALECLSNSSCYSAFSFSNEARSYLDDLASLTPRRTFYPSHLQVMETVKWQSSLPVLSQHPSFLPLVEHILTYWRGLKDFHSFGDLLDPIDLPSGMEHLSARADTRNWVYRHNDYSLPQLKDLIYQPRDCMNDTSSQERERLSFQVAKLSHPSLDTFPLCRTLRETVIGWREVEGAGQWKCKDIHQWLPKAKSMREIWFTLYELCRAANWPVNFELTVTLSLLGYCKAPFEILATLFAVSRRPGSTMPKLLSCPRLDLSLGNDFDQARVRQSLASHAIKYNETQESKIQREPGETKAQQRKRTVELYEARLAQELNEVVAELRSQWPEVPELLRISNKRLLQPPKNFRSTIRSVLLVFVHNRTFLQQVDHLHATILPFYTPRTIWELYIPPVQPLSRPSTPFTIPTMRDLLSSQSVDPDTLEPASQFEPSHLPLFKSQITSSLDDLFHDLSQLSRNDLENIYLHNLRESIDALANHQILDSCVTVPSFDILYSLHQTSRESCVIGMSHLQNSILPRDYTSTLLGMVGLLPSITSISLLQQLSLINRPNLPDDWKRCLIQYAIKLHDAKRAERMVQLFGTKRYSHLLVELQYRREWNTFDFVDWLLIEIDTNLSIRPGQADMAREMIHPSGDQNSVMQLNMGEGKSSVSQGAPNRNKH